MNLYVVDYEFYDTYEKIYEKDRWFFGCKNHIELEKTMNLNIKELERYGYEVAKYSYQVVKLTDNHKQILVK